MNIGLLVTGGTLDSIQMQGGLGCQQSGGLADFAQRLLSGQDRMTIIDSPWRQDSSQLSFDQVITLAETLERTDAKDAILVGVGTDTLSYLAPALWALSGKFSSPILLISGMKPWWMPGSDGAANVIDALAYARTSPAAGVEVVSAGMRLCPLNLRKFSHICPDPFRNVPIFSNGALRDVLNQITSWDASPAPPPPHLPRSPGTRNPVVPWLVIHPGLNADSIKSMLRDDLEHVVLSGYSGGTVPHWSLDAIPRGTCIHVISQQFGAMFPEQYQASSSLLGRNIHFWNLAGETLTTLLSVAIAFDLSAETALEWLRGIEKSIV